MRLSDLVLFLAPLLSCVYLSSAAPTNLAAGPKVMLDSATFVGARRGKVNRWLGIPYAKPPVGNLRFDVPHPPDPYTGTHTVTSFGLSCPQQHITVPIVSGILQDVLEFVANSIYGLVIPGGEDCLSLNVYAPTGVTASSKLPVVAWVFGGGFQVGGPTIYDGNVIVDRSLQIGQPVVYVSMNYRVSAFGFLASKEVKDAGVGNLGLRDQREALRWIQKYITQFGGDPTKVTLWGESAGAISASLQMLTNGGNQEGLFRAAFLQSGSPIPIGDISHGQQYYDDLVSRTGCAGAVDTLQCLRGVPYTKLKAGIDASPSIFSFQSLNLAWVPRVDGDFLTDNPMKLVEQGSVANVPFVSGDCDDEGTLFSLSTVNLTTDSHVLNYLTHTYLSNSNAVDVSNLLDLYPRDPSVGSPFETGILNTITPQFKRMAAIQGDLVFNAPRRFFLQQRAGKQNAWSFISKRLKLLPTLGSVHTSDILNIFGDAELTEYLIRFANHLDPNGGSLREWPKYTRESPKLMTFLDGLFPSKITTDTFRADGMNLLTQLALENPL